MKINSIFLFFFSFPLFFNIFFWGGVLPPPRPPQFEAGAAGIRTRGPAGSAAQSLAPPSAAATPPSQSSSGLPGVGLPIGCYSHQSRGEVQSHWLSAAEGRDHPLRAVRAGPPPPSWRSGAFGGPGPDLGGPGPDWGERAQIGGSQPQFGGPGLDLGGSRLGLGGVPARIGGVPSRSARGPGGFWGSRRILGVQPLERVGR